MFSLKPLSTNTSVLYMHQANHSLGDWHVTAELHLSQVLFCCLSDDVPENGKINTSWNGDFKRKFPLPHRGFCFFTYRSIRACLEMFKLQWLVGLSETSSVSSWDFPLVNSDIHSEGDCQVPLLYFWKWNKKYFLRKTTSPWENEPAIITKPMY